MQIKSSKSECIASRLRTARELAGLSQGQVARKMGAHRPTISEIEAGRRRVTAEELNEFAQLYCVTVSWLACEDTDSHDPDKDKIYLAARELSKLKKEDQERLFQIIRVIRE